MRMTRKSRRQRQRRDKLKKEIISIAKKGFGLTAAAMLFWSTFSAEPAYAMPSNGSVAAGNASIAQNGNVMNIHQSSNRAIINWRAFSIAANEIVNFNQPNANAVMLNRVLGNDPSKIFGQMNANGKVFLVNPNGVLFAPGAQVNVGGLLATTHSISDADFMNGNYKFISTNPDGQVINQGTIVAQNQGIVSLLAPEAINEGVIVAQKGTVTIASANQATFDFTGDGKLQLVVDESAVKALAENRGLIEAEGGLVLMTASAHRELGSAVVNQSGIVRATSLGGTAGAVELNAVNGTANLAGTIDVSGATAGATGGTVDIFAKDITLESSANINASSDTGGGTVRIGGDWQGSGDAPHADTVTIANGAVINADAIKSGDGGTVVAWSDGVTKFDGSISAKGGQESGNGGMVETSGHYLQITEGSVNASAVNGKGGEWLLDPGDIEITSDAEGTVELGNSGEYTGPAAGASTVKASTISKVLTDGTNVTIQTSTISIGGTGNITVSADIKKTMDNNNNTDGSNVALKLDAAGQIIVDAGISSTGGKLDVNLISGTTAETSITITEKGSISTSGGNVTIKGKGDGYANRQSSADPGVNILGKVDAGTGGNITIYGSNSFTNPSAATVGVAVGSGGSLISDGGNITINGKANNSNGTAVKIEGKVDAGAGTVAITGINQNSAGNGILIDNTTANALTAQNVSLTADKMKFGGSALVQGDSTGTLSIKQSSDIDVLISGTDNGSGLYLRNDLFDGSGVFQDFSNTVIGREDEGILKGTLTVGGATTFGTNTTLQANKIVIDADTTASGKTLTLKAANSANGTGIIIAKTLNLQGKNADFNLTGNNNVDVLTGDVKSVQFTDVDDFSVGSANAAGLKIVGDSTLTSNTGSITIAKDIEKTGVNDATLTVETLGATGDITVNSEVQIHATGTNPTPGKLNILFNSGQNININQNAELNSNGGFIKLNAGNNININEDAELNSKGGLISLTAGKNITLDKSSLNSTDGNSEDGYGGDINLTATDGKIKLTNGAAINSGSGNIHFRSKTLSLMDAAETPGGTINGTGTLTIDSSDVNGTIGIGGGSGTLQIEKYVFEKVFERYFKEIVIGRTDGLGTINIGELTSYSDLLIQNDVNAGPISFADNASLKTNNKHLTLTSQTINFANSLNSNVTVSAGSGNLTFNTDTITNWSKVSFGDSSGNFFIKPIKTDRDLRIGGASDDSDNTSLAVDEEAFKNIEAANFKDVVIGREDGSGKVKIGSFKLTKPINLSILSPELGGDAEILNNSTIIMSGDGVLTFKVYSLTQKFTNTFTNTFKVKNLLLEGGGSDSTGFILDKDGTKIENLAAEIEGDLTVVNDADTELTITELTNKYRTVTGVKTWEYSITFVADRLTLKNYVTTTGDITIYSKTDRNDWTINIGENDNVIDSLFLDSDYFSKTSEHGYLSGDYGSLNIGKKGGKYNIIIDNATFNSDMNFETDGDLTVSGNLNMPYKELVIDVGKFYTSGSSTIITRDFTLSAGNGIGGIHTGSIIYGTGNFTLITKKWSNGNAVYITYDTRETEGRNFGEHDYILNYTFLNDTANEFDKIIINSDTDVFIEDQRNQAGEMVKAGELNKALDITTKENDDTIGVYITGNLTLNSDQSDVSITTNNFTINSDITLNVNKGNFTLSTDNFTAGTNSHIIGSDKGTLTLQQRTDGVNMYVVNSTTKTGLVITTDQLKNVFGYTFASLTLGNADYDSKVYIENANIENNVTIQTGSGGTISIGESEEGVFTGNGLTVDGNVTLRGGTITNNGGTGEIVADGTINFYTNDLTELKGQKTVTGEGTLGIGTYDGTTAIYIGEGYDDTYQGLILNNELFDGTGAFDTTFTHYSFGSGTQTDIYVNDATFKENVTLTGHNINFEGNMTIEKTTETKGDADTLTINAFNEYSPKGTTVSEYGKATQTGGVITADKLLLTGGNFNLTKSENLITTLAAKANQVKVKSKTLTVGEINGVKGITADGSGTLVNETIYLETTDDTDPSALTVNEAIYAKKGDITLISDTMTFNNYVQGSGTLTVQQAHDGTSMGIGTNADGTLQLGSNLFNGDSRLFKEGFRKVILGRATGYNTVTVNGSLNFVYPDVIIRSAELKDNYNGGGGDKIIIKADANITTTTKTPNTNLEFRTSKLITEAGSTIDTGTGNLTLTADNVYLNGTTKGEGGYLYLRSLSKDRNIYIGGDYDSDEDNGVWFKEDYFSKQDHSQVFQPGYKNIIIGWEEGEGTLYQRSVTFENNVYIWHSKTLGKVVISGIVRTGGNNYTVESEGIEFKDADVDAQGGDISLITDNLEFTGGTIRKNIIKSVGVDKYGKLFITTYDVNKNIYFAEEYTGNDALVLEKDWFNGNNSVFKGKFDTITIGKGTIQKNTPYTYTKEYKGTITVGDINLDDLTKNLVLDNTGIGSNKSIYINGKLWWTQNNGSLTINSGGDIIEGTDGSVKVKNLTASAVKGKIVLDNWKWENWIKHLKTITAKDDITIYNTGDMEIDGTITKTGTETTKTIDIWTKGNLKLNHGSKIISALGDVYLTAQNTDDGETTGRFFNRTDWDTAKKVIDVKTGRWIISTYDSIYDEYGALMPSDTPDEGVAEFRKYNTEEYGGSNNTALVGNGFIHEYSPEFVIIAERVYGDPNSDFYENGTLKLIVDGVDYTDANADSLRKQMDAPFIGDMEESLTYSTSYSVGNGLTFEDGAPLLTRANVNKVDGKLINGAKHYGTDYNEGDPGYISYAGLNPLNYDVEIKFDITPRDITIKANDDSKVYDGEEYRGGNSYSANNLATWDNKKDGVSWENTLSGLGIDVDYDGDSQGAINYRDNGYDIDIIGNEYSDNFNYKINYESGKLTIKKRKVLVTAKDDSKEYDGKAYTGNVNVIKDNTVSYGEVADVANSGVVEKDKNVIDSLISGNLTYASDGGSSKSEDAVNVKVGGYDIDIGGSILNAQNYEFEYATGTLTITPKEVTVTAKSYVKIYNGKPYYTSTGGYTYKGFINGDEEIVLPSITVNLGGSADNAVNVGNYVIDADGTKKAGNYTFEYDPGTLTIYTSDAIEAEKTLNSNNNNALPTGISFSFFNFPLSPIADLTPPTPSAPPEADTNIILESGTSNSKGTIKKEGAGFALHFDYYENDRGHAGNSRTLGAIPILFAQDGEQKLDAIYVINYNHDNGKLAILPAAQRVTTPKLDEVRPDANHEFAIHYESTPLGMFEVSHGNGIVGIRPVDDMALESLIAGEKSVTKAVLANGILAAIKNISVMPDQIRAVYIFLEK